MTSWYVAGRQLAIEASLKEKGERERVSFGGRVWSNLFLPLLKKKRVGGLKGSIDWLSDQSSAHGG